ncbi:hypothetical protein G3M53_91085, partial [Streptomyces sp. SID7982]|nr:hypothetical protein [Streptomyces sp. SID7982]
QVALRCPDFTVRTADEVQRRWAADTPHSLVVGDPSVDIQHLYELLSTTHRDTVRVVLHGPPQQRSRLLPVCLAMGVPVVLWDRAATSHDDAP